ncbi:MAG: bacteriohemerythrin [Proteobacteria bacterium]|nr:bacteriohemerythrin [Pseudomonadota bacterium]
MGIMFSDDLKTNIVSIDLQHKELFRITNELLDACRQGKGTEFVSNVIDFLEKYVKTHFATEEKYMQDYNYTEYNFHKIQHEIFMRKVDDLKNEFYKNGPSLSFTVTVSSTIVNWLSNHIRNVDGELAKFLRKQSNFKE